MSKILILIICNLIFLTFADNLSESLQQVAIDARLKFKLSGITLSVIGPRESQVTISSGVANQNNQETLTNQSLFQVGSITKTFVAATVLQLVKHRQLNLNDKLGNFLPEYPAWEQITILQLLNQTSGLFSYDYDAVFWNKFLDNPQKIWTESELLAYAYSDKPYFAAGQGWHYSNTNYVLLGMVIEKISHKSLAQAFKEYLPGLPANIFYFGENNPPAEVTKRLAHGYHIEEDTTQTTASWLHGAGGVIANPEALAKWYWLLWNNQIIKTNQTALMTKFVKLKDGSKLTKLNEFGYGLGVFTMPSPAGVIWFTPGLTLGYMSIIAYLPCKNIVIAYSTNTVSKEKGLHIYLLSKIITALLAFNSDSNFTKNGFTLPKFCNDSSLKSKDYKFPYF